MKKVITILITLFLSVLVYTSCDDGDNNVPYVSVNITIQPNSTIFQNLNIVGGWEYITGGNKGIIVYRMTLEEFKAYDRTCPHDPDKDSRIEVQTSGITAIDSLCLSQFSLIDGAPIIGPAQSNMKTYHTSYDGINLRIYN